MLQYPVAREPFSGSGSKTLKFSYVMNGFSIINKGSSELTFTINGDTYSVPAGWSFDENFDDFREVTITASGAYEGYGRSRQPRVVRLPVDIDAPANVTSLDAVAGHNYVGLSWRPSTSKDVSYYRIYRDGVLIGTATRPSYHIPNLFSDTLYQFKVVAVDAAGNASSGVTITVTTGEEPVIEEPPPDTDPDPVEDTTPPNEVTGLTATPSETSVQLNWTASNSEDVAGYNVYQGTTKLNTSLIIGTTYQVTGLTAETAYTFKVTAVDDSGNESVGVEVSTTTTAASGGGGTGLTTVTSGLVHSYDFSKGSGTQTTLSDDTGNFNLTLTGFTFDGTTNFWTGNGLRSGNVGEVSGDMTNFALEDNSPTTFVVAFTPNFSSGTNKDSTHSLVMTGSNKGGLHLSTTSYGGRSAVGGRFSIEGVSNGALNKHPAVRYLTPDSEVMIHIDDYTNVESKVIEDTAIVITFSVDADKTASLYINNELQKSVTVTDMPKYHGFYLLKDHKTTHAVLVYNRALSQSEIQTVSTELLNMVNA